VLSYGGLSGNTATFVTTTGTQTSGDCVKIDASGNHIANGSACGGASATQISGLELSWVSASAINVLIGNAYVESAAAIVTVSATINLTSIALGNSVWGYVYLKSDGTAEVNTTAPAAPYAGWARSKTADTSRRFLGTVRTDASGNIYRFRHSPTTGVFLYQAQNPGASPFRTLSAGSATSATAVSQAAVVPPQSRSLYARFTQTSTLRNSFYGSTDYTVTTTAFEAFASGAQTSGFAPYAFAFVTCDTSQQVSYLNDGASGAAFIDVLGYLLER
jgi:hypothetical protein